MASPTTGSTATQPIKKRTMSKARLYKEVKKQAALYDMSMSSLLDEFLEKLGEDVIEEATK
jgi:hypothetical protein